jgi:hypothetical protein
MTTGHIKTAILNNSFDLKQLIKVIIEQIGSLDEYVFIIDGQQLDLNDDIKFNEQKTMIQTNRVIVVDRSQIETKSLQMFTLYDIIRNNLPGELKKKPKVKNECMTCCEEKLAMKFCHYAMCEECFWPYFVHSDFQIQCCICQGTISYQNIFVTYEFIELLQLFNEVKQRKECIDFQICTCSARAINETMYPKQNCQHCSRVFCFFCNEDWNNETMRNDNKYTCSSGHCYYERQITFDLVQYEYNKSIYCPTHRCCPKCLALNAYDMKCKQMMCRKCQYTFCCLCLKASNECIGQYQLPCTGIVRQSYDILGCQQSFGVFF